MKLLHRKTIAIGGLSMLLVLIAAPAYYWVAAAPVPSYVTAPVMRADIENSVIATGTIQPFRQVNVGAQASGQIKSLKVALGDIVKQGQLIAEIDSLTQQNILRNAEAALQNTEAQLSAKQALLRQYELALKRQSDMLAANASTQEAYEQAEAVLATTQADIAALKAQITQATITADTARLTLGYTRITAPMDGTVVAILNKEGQTVNAVQSTPTIIILARMDKVTVKAEISEADVPRVKPGQAVYFSILGDTQKKYTSTVRAIEPAPSSISDASNSTTTTTSTSPNAIYYNGLLDVPNPDGTLRISMTAEVHIVLEQAKGVLSMPASALGERDAQGLYIVSVLDEKGRAQPRKVRIGLNNKLIAEVLEGLQEGERIVLGEAGNSPRYDALM